ncbi:hypothetical protein [Nonomuraea montanisoli]|uniref:hypothetical protein n=1 Tax=Nonomuraea montanisoli TaxID=2741721 RepID=UPI001F16D014|nr:hypothetical protein [Nonomuraea montanisoli]
MTARAASATSAARGTLTKKTAGQPKFWVSRPPSSASVEGSSSAPPMPWTARATMMTTGPTHHWRVLRDSGVIRQRPSGRENLLVLRREDLDARYPGLLDAILSGARADDALEHGG